MLIKRLRSNVHIHEGYFFYPGMNFISNETAEKFFRQESFKVQFVGEHPQTPNMIVASDKKAESFAETVSNLNVKEALAVVQSTWLVDALEEIKATDKRQVIIHAAQVQLEELKKLPTPEEQMNRSGSAAIPQTVKSAALSLGDVR